MKPYSRRDWKFKASKEWEVSLGVSPRFLSPGLYDINGLKVNRKMCKDRGGKKFWFGVSKNYIDCVDEFVFICQGWGWFAIPNYKMKELSKITTVSHGLHIFNIYNKSYLPGNGTKIDISEYYNRNII